MELLFLTAVYFLAGCFAGLIAGLLGVGGGIVMVPALILVFEAQGFSTLSLTHMAIGSSLATIVLTSLSSIYNHHKLNSVHWGVFYKMVGGVCMGATIGVYSVLQLNGELLQQLIGALAVFVAIKMLYKSQRSLLKELPNNLSLAATGGLIGWVSAMFGIGGGTMSVPYLSRYRLPMVQVIGTSAAIGFPIAFAGSLANVGFGWQQTDLPQWSSGYIYWPAVLGVASASVVFARVGVRLAHRLPESLLKKCFALVLFVVGLKFLFL